MIEPRLVRAAVRYPLWVVGIAVLVTALLGWYAAATLRLDTDPNRLLDQNLPFIQTEKVLARAFPQTSDSIVIVVDGASAARTEAVARRLLARLQQETQLVESVFAPAESDFFARNGLLYLDIAQLEALSDGLTEAAPYLGTLAQDPSLRGLFGVLARSLDEDMTAAQREQLAKMLERIAATVEAQIAGRSEPIVWRDALMAGTGDLGNPSRHFLIVKPRLNYASFNYAEDALRGVRGVARAEAETGVRIRLTGDIPIEADELESVEKEMTAATLLSFALVLILLVLALRSIAIVFAVVATLVAGLVWTAAFAAAAIGHLNLISVSFAVLFIGFGVDFGIQFASRYREEAAASTTRDAALERTALGVGSALTLAAATAAVGFFSFAPTSYRGLAELGIIAGASMFLGLLANLTVLPALLRLLRPLRIGEARSGVAFASVRPLLQRRARTVIIVTAVLAVVSVALAPRARFDFNPINMKDPTTESVSTFMELLRDPDATPYTIDVLAKNLDEATALAARIEKLPTVARAVTLASFVPPDQPQKLATLEDMRLVLAPLFVSSPAAPPTIEEEVAACSTLRDKLKSTVAAHLERSDAKAMSRLAAALDRLQTTPAWPREAVVQLRHAIVSDLPAQMENLRALVNPSPIAMRDIPRDLAARYVASDGEARLEVFPKAQLSDNEALRRFVRDVQSIAPNATGAPVRLLEGGDAVIRSCIVAAALALGAGLVLLAIVLRRARDVLLVIVPMVLAALFTTATSVIANLPFNLANVIALPLLVTMTLAYAIYLIMRERSADDLARLFDSSTPRAVLFSALTTAVAFGSMAFSAHRGMSSMGLLLAISLGYAVVCTLIVLPALLALRPRRRLHSG